MDFTICYLCYFPLEFSGGSEMPDNLKLLFRTIAMMVPDFALIGEILLYSSGFVDARSLAIKTVTIYRLCSEQVTNMVEWNFKYI